MDLMRVIARLQRRLRGADAITSAAAGLIALAGATVAAGAWLNAPGAGAAAGLAVAATLVGAGSVRSRRTWTPLTVADHLESRTAGLDNLVLTAIELTTEEKTRSRLRDEVVRQALDRVARIRPERVVSLAPPLALLGMAAAGAVAVLWVSLARSGAPSAGVPPGQTPTAAITRLRVEIELPAYLGAGSVTVENPAEVLLVAGSTVRLDVWSTSPLVWIADGSERLSLDRGDGEAYSRVWQPTGTTTLAVAGGETIGASVETRLLTLIVTPDEAPRVRLTAPARDLHVASPPQALAVEMTADDDQALGQLELRFTRLAGSGESFTFTEGRVPITIERDTDRHWVGRATWQVAGLGLSDGDAIVYRAVARDGNPASDWASSESYTIEVGRRLDAAAAGFAVPEEDRRYAISQQMVILKTERLEGNRSTLGKTEWHEQTQLLAVEQRMVRSEVVFLSGGEVQDEVEEAEHAHELQEGRLENRGRAEMLAAINQMSRAEARLTAGDTSGALAFERAALAALQRAFDRRRYFLRTLPERSRIDPARRLSGDRRQAQSFDRAGAEPSVDPLTEERALMMDLAAMAESGDVAPPALVSRLASLEPRDAQWRAVAAGLASAASVDARRDAAAGAMALVAARARRLLEPSDDRTAIEESSPLRGWWADEVRRRTEP